MAGSWWSRSSSISACAGALRVVVTSLHRDYLPSSWDMYHHDGWDWSMYLERSASSLRCCSSLSFLPVISIFEMRSCCTSRARSTRGKSGLLETERGAVGAVFSLADEYVVQSGAAQTHSTSSGQALRLLCRSFKTRRIQLLNRVEQMEKPARYRFYASWRSSMGRTSCGPRKGGRAGITAWTRILHFRWRGCRGDRIPPHAVFHGVLAGASSAVSPAIHAVGHRRSTIRSRRRAPYKRPLLHPDHPRFTILLPL